MGDEVRGITSRDGVVWALFRALARGDFQHDFNERVDTRDLIVAKDEERFFEIAKRVSTKGSVWLRTTFKKYINQTIFNVLSSKIDTILPAGPGGVPADPAFLSEDDLLSLVGIPFSEIKEAARKLTTGQIPGPNGQPTYDFRVPGLPKARSYTLRTSSYRLGERGTPGYSENRNVSQMFRDVTGKNKFAIIVDASGGLPLTELLNSTLQPTSNEGGEFFILENIENDADSATKVSSLKATGVYPQIPKVNFLVDETTTVVYPLWKIAQDPKSNIYSSLQIVLNRIKEGEVEANISIVDSAGKVTETFQIGDVANSSNVKNATLYALATFLEKGIVPESLVYTLIKRMGDWCQALSLLDLDRVYSILDTDREPTGTTTTLRSMLVDTEIGLVTNDRILLAFAVMLGLNVFFTTAMDTARLIYFKNNDDVPSGEALDKRTEEIYQSAIATDLRPEVAAQTAAFETMKTYLDSVKTETNITEYIRKLRTITSNLAKLRVELTTLSNAYKAALDAYPSQTGIKKFTTANSLVSILTKLKVDIAYNLKTFEEIAAEVYPGSQAERIRLDALTTKLAAGGRITKSVEVVEAKEILLRVRDDLVQILDKDLLTPAELQSLLRTDFKAPNERVQTNYDEVLSVIPTIRTVLPGVQTGGGVTSLEQAYNALRTRTIRLVPPGIPELTSTINIYTPGSVYVDEKLEAYSVSDDCIVTDGDSHVFDDMFDAAPEGTPVPAGPIPPYVCLKYLLLVRDYQQTKFDRLVSTSDDQLDPETKRFVKGSVADQAFHELASRLDQLAAVTAQNVWPTTLSVYHTRPLAQFPGTIADLQTRLQAVRASLLSLFYSFKFPMVASASEASETTAIERRLTTLPQDVGAQVSSQKGYYSAAIAQYLLAKGIPPTQLSGVGAVIEQTLSEPLFLTIATSDQAQDPKTLILASADQIADILATKVGAWVQANRPELNIAEIQQVVRNVAKTIRSGATPLSPPPRRTQSRLQGGLQERRPLYSNARLSGSDSSRSDRNARLRRRPRTRRTARVRKQSRKSKTR